MNLILIRHGQSYKNIQGRHGRHSNHLKLTDEGKRSTLTFSKTFLSKNFEKHKIISANTGASIQTAQIFSSQQKSDFKIIQGLESVSYGILGGLQSSQIKKQFPVYYNQILNYNKGLLHPKDYTIPEMENIKSFEKRVIKSLKLICNLGNDVILFTHASTVTMILNIILVSTDSVINNSFTRYKTDNLGISKLIMDKKSLKGNIIFTNNKVDNL
jgi:broad specificity phosphatase PhoE